MACSRRNTSLGRRAFWAGVLACWATAGCASQDTVRGQAPAAYGPSPYAPTPNAPAPYTPSPYGSPQPGAAGYPAAAGAVPAYSSVPYVAPTGRSLPSPTAVSSAPGQRIVLQVVVEGVKGNVDKGLPRLKTRSGEQYDPQVVEDDVRLLLKSRKYVDVSPKVQPVSGGVIVIFQVVERPTIKYIKIVGCENKLKNSLLSKTDLKEKDGLDPYAIKEARDKLETYYHESGYDRVRVTIAEGLSPGDQGVVLLIDEGRSQKIWTTNFVGNKFVSAARLATQISSNPPMLYSKYLFGGFKGEADRKKIDEDVEKLTAYYRAFGFFQAKIGREWTFDEQENWMYLTFVINEGPQYKVRSISFIGEKTFDTARLSKDTKLHANEFFNQGAMNHDLATVRDLYGTLRLRVRRHSSRSAAFGRVGTARFGLQHQGRGPIPRRQNQYLDPRRNAAHQLRHYFGPPLAAARRHPRHHQAAQRRTPACRLWAVRNQRPEQKAEDRVQSAARNGRRRQAIGQTVGWPRRLGGRIELERFWFQWFIDAVRARHRIGVSLVRLRQRRHAEFPRPGARRRRRHKRWMSISNSSRVSNRSHNRKLSSRS